jgi:DNA-directed RNA polymerase subunit RPC12/RpoP
MTKDRAGVECQTPPLRSGAMDASKQAHDLAVIDDGTGVYLWSGEEQHPMGKEWVWKAIYRCERCGRAVTILRFERDAAAEQSMRRLRTCPGGCASIRERLQPQP